MRRHSFSRFPLFPLLLLSFGPPLPLALAGRSPELFLVGAAPGQTPSARAVHARLGETVTLYVVARQGRGRKALYFTDAPALVLSASRVPLSRLRPFAALGEARVRWFQVEPQPHHVDTVPPNKDNPAYSNAVLFGPRHGVWLGYDTLEYLESPISGASGTHLVQTRTAPSHPRVNVNHGLGTMRYKAVVEVGGRVLASPGAEATTRTGLSPSVLRVTFRQGDTWLGHLRGYFNVPNVFGSGGHGRRHQAELYQGTDCADVIIGGLRAAGSRLPYTSVAGLRAYTRPVTPRLLMKPEGIYEATGKVRVPLRFGQEVLPGDLLLIDYAGFAGSPRSWDHIAVIDRDAGEPGLFDPRDPVLHMGYLYGLTEEPAGDQAPAYIQVVRLKPRVLPPIHPPRRYSSSLR